jgi:hypothetical protein
MRTVAISLFVITCVYGVLAHFLVLFVLIKRRIPLEYTRIGVPGYLASICQERASGCGRRFEILARSSDVAFWLGLALMSYLLFSPSGRDAA